MNKIVKEIFHFLASWYIGYIFGVAACLYLLPKEVKDICFVATVNWIFNIIVKFANISCGIAAPLALYYSVKTHHQTVDDERRNNTLTEIRRIHNKCVNINQLSDYVNKRNYLNELEGMSIGTNLKLYSIEVIDIAYGYILIEEYEEWTKDFIEESRMIPGMGNVFCEYESMIQKLKKMQKKRKKYNETRKQS